MSYVLCLMSYVQSADGNPTLSNPLGHNSPNKTLYCEA